MAHHKRRGIDPKKRSKKSLSHFPFTWPQKDSGHSDRSRVKGWWLKEKSSRGEVEELVRKAMTKDTDSSTSVGMTASTALLDMLHSVSGGSSLLDRGIKRFPFN